MTSNSRINIAEQFARAAREHEADYVKLRGDQVLFGENDARLTSAEFDHQDGNTFVYIRNMTSGRQIFFGVVGTDFDAYFASNPSFFEDWQSAFDAQPPRTVPIDWADPCFDMGFRGNINFSSSLPVYNSADINDSKSLFPPDPPQMSSAEFFASEQRLGGGASSFRGSVVLAPGSSDDPVQLPAASAASSSSSSSSRPKKRRRHSRDEEDQHRRDYKAGRLGGRTDDVDERGGGDDAATTRSTFNEKQQQQQDVDRKRGRDNKKKKEEESEEESAF